MFKQPADITKFKYLGRFIPEDLVNSTSIIILHHVYDAYEALEDAETEVHSGKNKIQKGNLLLVYVAGERHLSKNERGKYVTHALNMEQMGRRIRGYLKQQVDRFHHILNSVDQSPGSLTQLYFKD